MGIGKVVKITVLETGKFGFTTPYNNKHKLAIDSDLVNTEIADFDSNCITRIVKDGYDIKVNGESVDPDNVLSEEEIAKILNYIIP